MDTYMVGLWPQVSYSWLEFARLAPHRTQGQAQSHGTGTRAETAREHPQCLHPPLPLSHERYAHSGGFSAYLCCAPALGALTPALGTLAPPLVFHYERTWLFVQVGSERLQRTHLRCLHRWLPSSAASQACPPPPPRAQSPRRPHHSRAQRTHPHSAHPAHVHCTRPIRPTAPRPPRHHPQPQPPPPPPSETGTGAAWTQTAKASRVPQGQQQVLAGGMPHTRWLHARVRLCPLELSGAQVRPPKRLAGLRHLFLASLGWG